VIETVVYRQGDGDCPFNDWFHGLRDKRAQSRILLRVHNVEAGNFGDCASVGEGVIELRVHVGAGYRVYCGRSGNHLVILLCGGDKSSQSRDIQQAKDFWLDWKRRKHEPS
jgi:putative addiction module killer protein